MLYRDLDLHIVPDGHDSFAVHAQSPSGEVRETLATDPAACVVPRGKEPEDGRRLSPPVREDFDRRIGGCLFQSLLPGDVRALFDHCRGEAESSGQGVRIRLRFDPRDGRLARLAGLPWELLYDRRIEQFLSLDPRTPVVRVHDVPQRPPLAEPGPPLRILLAGAEVEGQERLDLEEERRRVEKAVAGRDGVLVETLAHTRRSRLVDRLQDGGPDVLHLMMHGDHDDGQGCLIFEDGYGAADPVSGVDLARQLQAGPRPRLVVLNACLTAAGSETNAMTSVASALILCGCPAVVAMTSEIGDAAALAFVGRLYERLARDECLEEAMAKARLAVDAEVPKGFAEWSLPALFLSPNAVTTLFPARAEGSDARTDAEDAPLLESPAPPAATFKTKARHIGHHYNISAGTVSIGKVAAEE